MNDFQSNLIEEETLLKTGVSPTEAQKLMQLVKKYSAKGNAPNTKQTARFEGMNI